ncbi:MAG TPA: hypothetical protein VG797_03920 [Phycisphaerales bacterium]|nr:hypothetical protein [Phycisphaerales bacterium]
MKRWARRAVVCLLLGAVVNVLVAWGIAAWGREILLTDITESNRREWYLSELRWPGPVEAGWPPKPERASDVTLIGRRETVCTGDGPPPERLGWPAPTAQVPAAEFRLFLFSYGFPMPAMSWQTTEVSQPVSYWPHANERMRREDRGAWLAEGVDLPELVRPGKVTYPVVKRRLPLKPCVAGFAVNPTAYAAVVGVVWGLGTVAQRVVRRRRGLCRDCGYDLRGLPVNVAKCPECGFVRALQAVQSDGL